MRRTIFEPEARYLRGIVKKFRPAGVPAEPEISIEVSPDHPRHRHLIQALSVGQAFRAAFPGVPELLV